MYDPYPSDFPRVPMPFVPHDDLMAAYLADSPEFDRLQAKYYPDADDDDQGAGMVL